MRIIRLVMLGAMIVVTTLCFEAAWQGAQDMDEVLGRARWAQTDFIVRTHGVRAPKLQPPLEEVAEPEWQEVEPPGPKAVTHHRRFKRPPAVAKPELSLVAPEDAVRQALRRKRPMLEHCYEQELKKQASFDGFVVVSLSLTAGGKVTDAHVEEGKRRDAQVGACIVAQLKALRLPPLTEDAELLIPIRLQAQQATR